MVSEIASGVSALASIIGGIAGKSESDKLAKEIRKQKLTMPAEAEQMLGQAQTLSAMGMPGYETYKEQINELMPQTVQAARETAQSPSALIDLYAKGMAQTNRAYNELAAQDAAARRQNIINYQNVLGQVAQMRSGIQQANIQTNLAALGQEAQGTKDLISGISNAPGAFIKGYVGMEQAGVGQDIASLFNKSATPSTSMLAPSGIPSIAPTAEPTPMATFANEPVISGIEQPTGNFMTQWYSPNRTSPNVATFDDYIDELLTKYTTPKIR